MLVKDHTLIYDASSIVYGYTIYTKSVFNDKNEDYTYVQPQEHLFATTLVLHVFHVEYSSDWNFCKMNMEARYWDYCFDILEKLFDVYVYMLSTY